MNQVSGTKAHVQRGSGIGNTSTIKSDKYRGSLLNDMQDYVARKPKWVEKHLDNAKPRPSMDVFSGIQINKRCSTSTATTMSTDQGSHHIIPMLDQYVDEPIREISSSSNSIDSHISQQKKKKKVKLKKQNNKATVEPVRFKTELCKNWSMGGKCNYGKKCQFAHGTHELSTRPELVQNYKYKSKFCHSYHQDHACQYGTRCQFIHENRSVDQIRKEFTVQTQQLSSSLTQTPERNMFGENPRLKTMSSITNQWNQYLPLRECLRRWTRQTQGLLFQINSSSSSE